MWVHTCAIHYYVLAINLLLNSALYLQIAVGLHVNDGVGEWSGLGGLLLLTSHPQLPSTTEQHMREEDGAWLAAQNSYSQPGAAQLHSCYFLSQAGLSWCEAWSTKSSSQVNTGA